MIEGSRQLPVHHLTARVPWHDSGWQGTFCSNPCDNTSCTILPRIAAGRDDAHEVSSAGKSIEGLDRAQQPPCIDEHGTIMAPFSVSMLKNHPYAKSSESTHSHFAPTPYVIQPYSLAAIPFRWMLKNRAEGDEKNGIESFTETLQLGYIADREPELSFQTSWVQEGRNQRIMLDTFFSATKPEESLIFFYAKRTPLIEDTRRVIVGVGRIKTVGPATEYRYSNGSKVAGNIDGYLWERNIEHSIRPSERDGFLLPYSELLKLEEHEELTDIEDCVAFAPEEYFEEYSYGCELLPQDGAIASLLELEKAISSMRDLLEAPWEEYLNWIDCELNRLWQARGAFPGMGAALHAFGMPKGNLLAWYLGRDTELGTDPWGLFSKALAEPEGLPNYIRDGIGPAWLGKWLNLPDERRALLKLLARFNITNNQATRWYQSTERKQAGIALTDTEILENPYLIFETDRLQVDPISFAVIDRGLFPTEKLREVMPIPEPSFIHEAIDPRRVRALLVHSLENAARDGHTLLPSSWLIQRIRNMPMKPPCPLDEDTISIFEDTLNAEIAIVDLAEAGRAFQLRRYLQTSKMISQAINRRTKGISNKGDFNWTALVDQAIGGDKNNVDLATDDKKARYEKAAALQELFSSRVSVLMGSAGTGKSTLLRALCGIEEVRHGGILLLAPTGKARVRLEQASGVHGQGRTVAQFLNGLKRYDGSTGRYYVNESAPRSSAHKTVVVDECSMLTEDQLAALLDALKGVQRLILVGDPKQLPPIGAGRPYVDIVQRLRPADIDSLSPRVAPNFAELTVTMRQQNDGKVPRTDLLLAGAFSGSTLDAGADEVWNEVATGQTGFVKLIRWDNKEELQKLLLAELVNQLELKSLDDEVGFEETIGGVRSENKGITNVFFNTQYKTRAGSAERADEWQILTPTRQTQSGVISLNRAIQQQFRKRFTDLAVRNGMQHKIITSPAGPEGIIYGDKVINITNSGRRKTYPLKQDSYVANGDIGIVTGHRRMKNRNWKPYEIEVELASQPGFSYKYLPWEFDGEKGSPPLELAYALTIHKTQGSEFGLTFLVVPNPCRALSREMLYTALTRHKDKVVILHQGDFLGLERYSHDEFSEVLRRMTNLFRPSQPVEVKNGNRSAFLDKNLIYRTEHGELVRSKSEWIIADKLHNSGIDYQYEQQLVLAGVKRFPDFTIADDESGRTWYWEHNGMLSNEDYRRRWQRKLAAYRQEGILPLSEGGGENGTLLLTEEKEGIGLNSADIQRNIDAILGA